jgi:predicted kinase
MEAVIFVGLQGAGKSSFFRERFFSTHVRISLDLVRTRNREQRFLATCIETKQRFVIDNTNPTHVDRAKFIGSAKQSGFRVVGYYFQSRVEDCLRRNESRNDAVPEVAILSTAKKLEIPSMDEGFDELFYVHLTNGGFVVEERNDEI